MLLSSLCAFRGCFQTSLFAFEVSMVFFFGSFEVLLSLGSISAAVYFLDPPGVVLLSLF